MYGVPQIGEHWAPLGYCAQFAYFWSDAYVEISDPKLGLQSVGSRLTRSLKVIESDIFRSDTYDILLHKVYLPTMAANTNRIDIYLQLFTTT